MKVNAKAALEDVDVEHNADLYIAIQDSRGQHAKLGAWLAQNFVQRQRKCKKLWDT